MNRNQKARAARGDDRSNGGDKVVKILRVYESGKVRAARTPPGGWNAKGRAHALPSDVSDKPAPTLAEATGERVKNPAKVAAGKARAEKARLAREAAGNAPAAKKPAAKAKAKRHPKAGPKKLTVKAKKPAKPSPFPTAAKTKPPASAKPKAAKKGKAAAKSEPGPNAMVVVAVRVTKAQKRKLGKLGGGEWMRDKIERATIPAA